MQGAALQVAVSTSVAELGASVDSQINAVMSNMTVAGVSLRRAQSVGAAALTASVTVQIRRVNVSIRAVTSALALKRDERLHMWSGSCSNHGDGGWREYCFDRQDINTGLPYFRKESNSVSGFCVVPELHLLANAEAGAASLTVTALSPHSVGRCERVVCLRLSSPRRSVYLSSLQN